MINGIAANTNIRILYDGGVKTCQPFNIYEQGTTGTTGLTSYPQTGHFNNALTPTFDINFGVCDYYFYQTMVLTNNNLYNLYWRRTVNQINVGKMLIASFHLNEADVQTLKLNDKIRIDNSWWNINKIIDYNANDEVLTKVELISIDTEIELANFPIVSSRPIGDILAASGISEINDQIKKQSNVNLSEGNFQIYGKGNVVPSGLKGIVIGDNQSVTEDGITTTNLTVTQTINGQSVTEILPTYKKYIATISQTGILDPVVTILENTIGDIVWIRTGVGNYEGVLTNGFPSADKTYLMVNQVNSAQGVYYFTWASTSQLFLQWYDFSLAQTDSVLINNTIEIRVYP
jgi:acetyltransferase-like isoleucine patch superfamily enzyme